MDNSIETIVKELGRLIAQKDTINFVQITVDTKEGIEYKYNSLFDTSLRINKKDNKQKATEV